MSVLVLDETGTPIVAGCNEFWRMWSVLEETGADKNAHDRIRTGVSGEFIRLLRFVLVLDETGALTTRPHELLHHIHL